MAGGLLLFASPALAREIGMLTYYRLHAEGTMPERRVFYLRERPSNSPGFEQVEDLRRQSPRAETNNVVEAFRSADVLEVREAANGPGTVVHEIEARCDVRLIKLNASYSAWRNYRKLMLHEKFPEAWVAATEAWHEQALRFLCSEDHFEEIGLGFRYAEIEELTWKRYWPDGQWIDLTSGKFGAETLESANNADDPLKEALSEFDSEPCFNDTMACWD